jgi:hypothetical protein
VLLGNGYIDPRVTSMANYNPAANYEQHYLAGAYSPYKDLSNLWNLYWGKANVSRPGAPFAGFSADSPTLTASKPQVLPVVDINASRNVFGATGNPG